MIPRGNGKPTFGLPIELGIPLDELEEVAAKYRPTLERMGVLEGLSSYQERLLFIWLYKHDREKGEVCQTR